MEAPSTIASPSGVESLLDLIAKLRSEDGCPWDRKQTARTMAAFMTEEVYELVDAVASEDAAHVCEELGDVLFHILFITTLFSEKGAFGFSDVMSRVLEKMIRRHPHVFGSAQADTPEAVKRQWEIIKREERGDQTVASILDGIPAGLPPLLRAYRVSQKAAGVGFDWGDLPGVMEKVEEEWAEFGREAVRIPVEPDAKGRAAMEFGDLLFTLTNVARFAGFHPDTALVAAIGKFEERFRRMERLAGDNGESIDSVPMNRLEAWWRQVKKAVSET